MPVAGELLVSGCRPEDLALLRRAFESEGPQVRAVSSLVELARLAVSSRPLAVVMGIGRDSVQDLAVIAVIRRVWADLPLIVVAEDDSLELERRAREAKIFYYSVHPIDTDEVRAVLEDLMRRSADQRGRRPRSRR